MPYVLIIITYLGGSAWGPVTTMQEFSTEVSCQDAREAAISMIDGLNKTNLAGGSSRREIVKAQCVKK